MKKILTVLLVLTMVVGAVFAAEETNRITLKSDVNEVAPKFNLYGSLTSYSDANKVAGSTGAAFSGTELKPTTNVSIADNDITAYFTITQVNTDTDSKSNKYARYKGEIEFEIVVGAFTEQPAAGATLTSPATVDGHITEVKCVKTGEIAQSTYNGADGTAASGTTPVTLTNAVSSDISEAIDDNTASVKASYNGKVVNQDVARFTAKWYHKDTLPNATYKADVTITYTVG